ncbi:hypothetical protein SUGI_1028460 [Cryptomeria japonica]|uniref:floral homeotic protein APETALA 1 C n=1 Tax=Cryptomeria japonica TaxID=3369 RepID=UPI0024149F01|nr:floral homeotic protein APETALA 1 C [Cryptomeria japonica]GLJ48771.1 hypothetical protein SUGI_1028460 [Cryptomeria japonica]
MGKRKLMVAYRADKLKRQKTFHDRKAGLFKKATNISVLCGCKVFVRIKSEDGEIFEFGEDSNSHNGALVSTSFALPPIDNDSQEHLTKESLSTEPHGKCIAGDEQSFLGNGWR